MAVHRQRLGLYALSGVGSELLAALVFTTPVSPWVTAGLACGATVLNSPSLTVTPTLLLDVAGTARTTATALFAVSNQLGAFGGPALGGVLLALGGFPLVGLCWLGVSILAAVVVRLKVRESAAFLAQHTRRQGTTAPE